MADMEALKGTVELDGSQALKTLDTLGKAFDDFERGADLSAWSRTVKRQSEEVAAAIQAMIDEVKRLSSATPDINTANLSGLLSELSTLKDEAHKAELALTAINKSESPAAVSSLLRMNSALADLQSRAVSVASTMSGLPGVMAANLPTSVSIQTDVKPNIDDAAAYAAGTNAGEIAGQGLQDAFNENATLAPAVSEADLVAARAAGAKVGAAAGTAAQEELDKAFKILESRPLTDADIKEINRKTPAENIRNNDATSFQGTRIAPVAGGSPPRPPDDTLNLDPLTPEDFTDGQEVDWDRYFKSLEAQYNEVVTKFIDDAITKGIAPDTLREQAAAKVQEIAEFRMEQAALRIGQISGDLPDEHPEILSVKAEMEQIDKMLSSMVDQRLKDAQSALEGISTEKQSFRFFPSSDRKSIAFQPDAGLPGIAEITDFAAKSGNDAGKEVLRQMVTNFDRAVKQGIPAESEQMAKVLTSGFNFGGKKGLSMQGMFDQMDQSGIQFPGSGQFPIAADNLEKSIAPSEIPALMEKIKREYLDVYRDSVRWKAGQKTIADVIAELGQSGNRRDQFLFGQIQRQTATAYNQGFSGQELASKVFNEDTMKSVNQSRQTQGLEQFPLLDMDKSVKDFDGLATSLLGVGKVTTDASGKLSEYSQKERSFTKIRNEAMIMRNVVGAANQFAPGIVPAPVQMGIGMLDNLGAVKPDLAANLLSLSPPILAIAAAIGGVSVAYKSMLDVLSGTEAKRVEIDRLNKVFGDTEQLVGRIKEDLGNQVTSGGIQQVLGSVQKNSFLAGNQDKLETVASMGREQSQKLQVPFEQFTPQMLQAIQQGNVAFLEQAGLVENGAKVLREYADSAGTTTGELSNWQVQEALVNAIISENATLLTEATTAVERHQEALDRMSVTGSEAWGKLNKAMEPFLTTELDALTFMLNGGWQAALNDVKKGMETGDFQMLESRNKKLEAQGKAPLSASGMETAMARTDLSQQQERLAKIDAELARLAQETEAGKTSNNPAEPLLQFGRDNQTKAYQSLRDDASAKIEALINRVAELEQAQRATEPAVVAQKVAAGTTADTQSVQQTAFDTAQEGEYSAFLDQINSQLALMAKQHEIAALAKQRLFAVNDVEEFGMMLDGLKAKLDEVSKRPVNSVAESETQRTDYAAIAAQVSELEAAKAKSAASVAEYDSQLAQAAQSEQQLQAAADSAALGLGNLGGAAQNMNLDQARAEAEALAAALDRLENSAVSAGYSLAARLVPKLGMQGAIGYGKQFAAEADQLQQGIEKISANRQSQGLPAITQNEAQMAFSALQAGQADSVNAMTRVGDTGVAQADRVKKAWENAMESVIPAREDTTKGLLPTAADPKDEKQLAGILGAYDDVKKYGKDPKTVAMETSAIMNKAGGGRQETIDENARRMADVVKLGTASPNFATVANLIPDDIKEKGEQAIREYAAGLLVAHQQGMTNALLDVQTATDQAIAKIKQKQTDEDFKSKVMENLQARRDAGEFGAGMSDEDLLKSMGLELPEEKMAAAAQKMGATVDELLAGLDKNFSADATGTNPIVEKMTIDETDTETLKTQGTTAATAVGEAFTTQITTGDYGAASVQKIIDSIATKQESLVQSGKDAANWWGGAFTKFIGEHTPTDLYAIMVPDLLKLIIQAQAASATGAAGSGANAP